MAITRGAASVIVVAAVIASLTACAGGESSVTLPPEGGAPDYQLGDGYPPADGVDIVVRDRTSPPPENAYSICYVNAFQTQPGEQQDWPDELLLAGADGDPVIDPDWPDEVILDTSTDDKREAIEDILTPWIQACASAGFDAVEFDNLDTYARTDGALTLEDNVELAEDLVEVAHEAGLAAAQKNSAEDSRTMRDEAEFDFAIAEQCAEFDECAAYEGVYGERVIDVEYDAAVFRAACLDGGMPRSAVLRDRDLTSPADPAYVFELCTPLE